MASVSVLPPSVNGTTNDYGSVTGLTLIRTETTNPVTTQTGTNFRVQWSPMNNTPGPVVVFNLSQSGTNIGLNLPQSTATDSSGYSAPLYGTMNYNLTLAGATNVSSSGSGTMTTDFTTSAVFAYDPGTTLTFTGTFLLQGQPSNPNTLNTQTATVQYLSAVNTTQNVTVPVYTFTNNTGDSVTVEGTTITDGSTLAVALSGPQFDITYTEPGSESEDPYQEQEQTEQEETPATPAPTVSTIAPVYIYGTGATGFGTGLTGYFYPLYTDINAPALSGGYHIHTFTEYEGYTFYMPNGSMNHAMADRPIGINLYITGNTALDNLEPIEEGNPNYASLLAQAAAETDPIKKDALLDEAYQFNVPLTQSEQDLFGYINSGYIENDPNATDGTPDAFISYVGVYYDNLGRSTGTS